MSEVATLEQATSDAPATPVSDDSLQATAAAGELNTGDVETSTEESDDTSPELTPEEDYAALVKKADAWTKGEDGADPLSTEEKSRLRSYEQSAADRQRAQQQARELQRQDRERLNKLDAEAPDRVYNHVQAEIDAAFKEGRNISPTLLKTAIKNEVSALLSQAAPLALREYTDGLGGFVLEIMDTPEVRQALAQANDFPSRLQLALNASYTRGQQESPDAKALEAANKKVTRLESELQKLKGERGAKGSGASSEGKGSTANATPQTAEDWAKYWASDPEGARQR